MGFELLVAALACAGSAERAAEPVPVSAPAVPAALIVTSATFADGATMPDSTVYSGHDCTGGNRSPALAWAGAPETTLSYAVIGHDPDAPREGGWTHWVLFDVPAAVTALPEDAGDVGRGGMIEGSMHGTTDFGERAYGGPCPPPGAPHHYEFTVYALDVPLLPLSGPATRGDVEQAIAGHVVGTGKIVGLYGR